VREIVQKWHNMVLSTHDAILHETLVYPHHLVTESAKIIDFEDKDGIELPKPLRGYFALKDVDSKKTKYFIEDEYYSHLPIRVNEYEELRYKDSSRSRSVVHRPTDITPFRIKAENMFPESYKFMDDFIPFEHSQPELYDVNKIIALVGLIGKTFCGISSNPEFGKSSVYLALDAITKKCPVFQPRSIPGVLAQITGDGNMIFDEPSGVSSDVKKCMENVSLQVAGNTPWYINGALKAVNTKPKYNVADQSITYLYNLFENYSDPDGTFFDYMWTDKDAMHSRFLKMKFDGKLTEKFDKDFNIIKVAEDNKLFYMKIAKHLLYLKEVKKHKKYEKRFKWESGISLIGRHKIIYDEIDWGMDLFSQDSSVYENRMRLLDKCISDYNDMIGRRTYTVSHEKKEESQGIIEEEVI
jgi:hypothetical protein